MKQQLRQLGFDLHESDVYLALLDVGETKVGEIINKTRFHREQVYEALKRLERKGYVRSSIQKKIRHYHAESPEVILRKITDLEKIAADILPDLKKRFKESPQMIRVLEGPEGFQYIFEDQLRRMENGGEIMVIGAAGAGWYDIAKGFYKPYMKKRVEQKIRLNMVTYEGQEGGSWQDPDVDQRNQEVRVLPWKFETLSDTSIYLDTVVIQIFGDPPLTIMIQNEKVARSYENYFDVLWKMAR